MTVVVFASLPWSGNTRGAGNIQLSSLKGTYSYRKRLWNFINTLENLYETNSKWCRLYADDSQSSRRSTSYTGYCRDRFVDSYDSIGKLNEGEWRRVAPNVEILSS